MPERIFTVMGTGLYFNGTLYIPVPAQNRDIFLVERGMTVEQLRDKAKTMLFQQTYRCVYDFTSGFRKRHTFITDILEGPQ